MAKKLDTTPDGLICRVCHRDLPAYHFFSPRGKINEQFFASKYPDGHTCFECGGDYRCIICHEIKPASAFRIQGRICKDCRNRRRRKSQEQPGA